MSDRTPTGDLDAALPETSVRPMGRLHGYKIADGDPDVRGWTVFGADGVEAGEVSELLVDVEAGRVRFLDVAIDTDTLALRGAPVSYPATAGAGAGLPPATVTAHSAMAGVAPLIAEGFVRGSISDEENAMLGYPAGGAARSAGADARHVLIPIERARLDPAQRRVSVETLTAGQIAELPVYDDRMDVSGFGRVEDQEGAPAEGARWAGMGPENAAAYGAPDRPVTGELDRALDTPPVKGRP